MLGVMASEPHGPWVTTMLHMYDHRTFIKSPLQLENYTKVSDTKLHTFIQIRSKLHKGVRHLFTQNNKVIYDLTTNVSYFAAAGVHRPEWVHIYPVEYFCPILTTGEDVRLRSSEIAQRNYCEHKGLHSWSGSGGWKQKVLSLVSPKMKTKLIILKRALFN